MPPGVALRARSRPKRPPAGRLASVAWAQAYANDHRLHRAGPLGPVPHRIRARFGRVRARLRSLGRDAAAPGGGQGAAPRPGRRRRLPAAVPLRGTVGRPRWPTRTCWPSSTGARTTAARSWSSSSSAAARCATCSTTGGGCRSPRRCRSGSRRPTAWPTRTAGVSSTVTSSRPTSSSTPTPGFASPTSAWPGPSPRRRSPSPSGPPSARPGTPPPSRRSGNPVDGRADVYALALVLYEAVTGVVPFTADTTFSTLMARVGAVLPGHDALGPLAGVLDAAATPDPDDRLDAAGLAGAAAGARPPRCPPPTRCPWRWSPGRPRRARRARGGGGQGHDPARADHEPAALQRTDGAGRPGRRRQRRPRPGRGRRRGRCRGRRRPVGPVPARGCGAGRGSPPRSCSCPGPRRCRRGLCGHPDQGVHARRTQWCR